ncbi:DUF2213 domain-containing protein [Sinorhizobium medicae]|uniref:DUF2213 domain-containing protein n=1 Tax=Sinorhizobium medicae TaxID=110321 RepID=A0ABX4TR51_9HYPH|nr:DUF2213 domain-containing protein [Sinorhizobium medicae]MDX0518725.1 DUF2213 domain-containing protein [Sinorhizobium medicae]MDX0729152.1 DUF2213 domain-containing protein [Sinorhizobium medicae]MDX0735336.1 DUF2213 domain-containing protein [Sinorhizobium medicae]MDX0815356.1 DUF2213 domain-containing protein [Sinorhizobium medicae]MDX1103577.1 DUF2213 domain-containing protein [Sinorhizobium medicae]
MKFTDLAPIAGTRRTADGYLVADVRTARTGIQLYAGHEVGKPEMATVKVYRPEDQVFDKASLGSYAHKPVTSDHPDEAVTADNWKALSVGQIGDEVARDGEFVRIPLIVMDGATIGEIEGGKRELSAGYTCDLAWEPGTTPAGEKYDAIQKDIRINHVAIVQRGRAGSEARIGDGAGKWGVSPVNTQIADERIPKMDLRKILVDGLTVETTDQGAQAITKLQKDLESSAAKFVDAEKAHQTALVAKDAELAKKDAEIDALKGKILSDADLDKRVQARADLITKAHAIAKDVKTEGLSDAAIRKAVVVAMLGDAAVAGKSEAYIDARFDMLVEDASKNGADPFRTVVQQGLSQVSDADKVVTDAYSQMVADMKAGKTSAAAN